MQSRNLIGQWVWVTIGEDKFYRQVIMKEPGHPEGKIWGVADYLNNKVDFFTDNDLKEAK